MKYNGMKGRWRLDPCWERFNAGPAQHQRHRLWIFCQNFCNYCLNKMLSGPDVLNARGSFPTDVHQVLIPRSHSHHYLHSYIYNIHNIHNIHNTVKYTMLHTLLRVQIALLVDSIFGCIVVGLPGITNQPRQRP